ALARAAAIDAIEALGEARDVLRRDADARILDFKGGALVALAPAQPHHAAFRRIANGVAHEVGESARELLLAADEARSRRALDLDAVPPPAQRARFRAEALDDARHVDRLVHRRRR